jgi:hypothetical protein
MIGPISAAVAIVAFTLIIVEETRWAKSCKELYVVKFSVIPTRSIPTVARLENIASELNLDANGDGTKYWVHGRSLFCHDGNGNGFSMHLGKALLFRDYKREHAFV